MGRKLHYKPGSFYRTDDRTGFPQRAENTKKEWTGLIVSPKVWEPRQPQDLVKGVPDIQSVEDPRPLGANIFVGPTYLTLSQNVGPGTQLVPIETLPVQGIFGVSGGDQAGVILDDGSVFRTVILGLQSVPPAVIIFPGLPGYASSGNEIIDYHMSYAGPALPQYLATESGQPILTEDGKVIFIEPLP